MTATLAPTITAATIAAQANTEFTRMANTWENTNDMDADTRRRLVATLRTGKARATGPRTVTATLTGRDARRWSYRAADALDAASADSDEVFATGRIDQTGPATWVLTW